MWAPAYVTVARRLTQHWDTRLDLHAACLSPCTPPRDPYSFAVIATVTTVPWHNRTQVTLTVIFK